MKNFYSKIKLFRVIFSLTYFLSIVFLFLEFKFKLAANFADYILFFQFAPSLIKFIFDASLLPIIYVLSLLFLTLIFGRFYCSFLCPLGVLQDIFIKLFQKLKILKQKFQSNKLQKLQYVLTIIIFSSLAFNFILPLSLFDPYSIAGKLLGNFLIPLVVYINNEIAYFINSLDFYFISPEKNIHFNFYSALFSLILFAIVFVALAFYGRFYCNSICPVGGILSFASKFSLFKLKISSDQCLNCSLCQKYCKANCIDYKNNTIDFSRCVLCFNCLTYCSKNGIKFELDYKRNSLPKENGVISKSRRNFLNTITFSAAGILILNDDLEAQKRNRNKNNNLLYDSIELNRSKQPIIPPGAISLQNYSTKCVSCMLCVASCPTKVIVPTFNEFGWDKLFIPKLDYNYAYCQYDCVVCSEVCPTDAILKITIEQKQEIQLGKVRFKKRYCIVHTNNVECGACSEHCPTKAVNMIPYRGLHLPAVNDKICVGCGACEHVCPARPRKAIIVEAHSIHQKAQKPKSDFEERTHNEKLFPF